MARSALSAAKSQVEELKRANEQLKAENIRLKARLGKRRTPVWRNILITLCLGLAVVVLMAGNLAFWAGNTLINTDKYVATARQIGADKTIQTAVADYTTVQIFNQVDAQAFVTAALPPRAEFLAPQLTGQLKGATEKLLEKRLASDTFQMRWAKVNRVAHERLISAIKESKTADGVINLQDVYDRLSQSLENTKLSFLTGKTLPQKTGSITVIDAPWIPKARFVVTNIGWLKPVSLALVAIFSAIAIWLTRNKRRLVIILAAAFALAMVATLIATQIAQARLAAQTQPAYQAAVGNTFNIILQPLVHQTVAIMAFSLLAGIIAWLTGPYRWARGAVSATRRYLTIPAHNLIFGSENAFTKWVAANRQTVEWVIVAVLGLSMLSVTLSLGLVALYAAIILVSVLVVETLAAPHSTAKR